MRRKTVHVAEGIILAILIYFNAFSLSLWSAIAGIAIILSLLIQGKILKGRFVDFLAVFSRPKELKLGFLLKGPISLLLGAIFSYLAFNSRIAFAGMIVVTIGDATAALYGKNFGKIHNPFNPDKHIEDSFVGAVVAAIIIWAVLRFPFWIIFVSALIPLFLQTNTPIKRNGAFIKFVNIFFEILDDNIYIPLLAGLLLGKLL